MINIFKKKTLYALNYYIHMIEVRMQRLL